MSPDIIIYVAIVAFLLFFIILFFFMKKTSSQFQDLKKSQDENKAMDLMQQQIGQLSTNLDKRLHYFNNQFQKTTGQIGSTLGDVKRDMGRMESATREVLEKAKNIAELENLLRAPKFRGGMGELFLGDLLSQILPPAHYSLQYKFKSGDMVDAVIKLGDNLVPVDSKFPLETFKKLVSEKDKKEKNDLKKKFVSDIKKHITSIATKYILPDEGTYDFALMYIPAENVYYESILKEETFNEEKSIFSCCTQNKVIPVSPNSFFAYLQVIIFGLKGLQIEKSAKKIFQSLAMLQRDLERYKKDFQVLGSHLNNAKSKYDDADKRLDKFSGRLQFLENESPDHHLKSSDDTSVSESGE